VQIVADDVGQVLDEVTTARDVQHLTPAADREDRQVAFEGGGQQRELGAVAIRVDAVGLRVGLLAVEAGLEVGAPRQE
jgi:hypothetical protein